VSECKPLAVGQYNSAVHAWTAGGGGRDTFESQTQDAGMVLNGTVMPLVACNGSDGGDDGGDGGEGGGDGGDGGVGGGDGGGGGGGVMGVEQGGRGGGGGGGDGDGGGGDGDGSGRHPAVIIDLPDERKDILRYHRTHALSGLRPAGCKTRPLLSST